MKKYSLILFLMYSSTSFSRELNVAFGNFDYSDKGKSAAMLELTYGFT